MQRLESSVKSASPSRLVPNSNYFRAEFESTRYSVQGYSYPEDLMEVGDYGYNRVIFYINVSVDSRALKGSGEIQVVEGVQRDQRGELVGQKITTGEAAGAAGAAGAVAGGLASKLIFEKGKAGSAARVGAGAGAVVGAGGAGLTASNVNNQEVGQGQTKAPTFSRPQKRLQSAIALYIPNQLSVRYSAGWSEEETFGFAAAAAGAREVASAVSSEANKKRTGTTMQLVQSIGTSLALQGRAGVPFAESMGIAAGLAANPKKEQAFKNIDFRTFTFEYLFAPKSENEAQNVLDIIQAFKYHMHPEFKSPDNFLYIYPSEFDIVYYKGSLENLALHRHTSCVLTELNVNYTPNGVFTTFPNGMPTQISMTMTFKELQLLTKEAIERFA